MISVRAWIGPSSVVTVNGRVAEVDARDVAPHDLGAEALGLRAHGGHQIGPHDAVAEAGKILDGRRHHELAAGLEPFDDDGRRFARAVYSAAVRPAGPEPMMVTLRTESDMGQMSSLRGACRPSA